VELTYPTDDGRPFRAAAGWFFDEAHEPATLRTGNGHLLVVRAGRNIACLYFAVAHVGQREGPAASPDWKKFGVGALRLVTGTAGPTFPRLAPAAHAGLC